MSLDDRTVAQAIDNVRQDVLTGFDGILTPGVNKFRVDLNGPDLNTTLIVASSDAVVAVPWVYPCVHTGLFLGVAPTFVSFDLRGTTFVDARGEPDGWQYHRYIDFLGALQNIGVPTVGRPVLNPPEYDNWATQAQG